MTTRSTAILITSLAASLSLGQSSVPSVNQVQAIVGARIEVGDGRVIEKGNVVMRDGIITAVGDAHVPKGAETLDGAGLTVYPGFIDAYTNKGLKVPDPVKVIDDAASFSDYTPAFMPTENRKGIRPEIVAARYFQPGDDVLRPYGVAGFTTAVAVPPGYIGGLAAMMNLGGRPASQSAVNPSAGIGFSFADVSGDGYPGSLLGAIAHIRQALADASHSDAVNAAYGAGGPKRPGYDEGLRALASSRSGLSLFEVSSAAEIDRVLLIAQEFGLRPAIVGGTEAWRRSNELKGQAIPVILQLGFGQEPAVTPDKKDPPNEGDDPGDIENLTERTTERKRLFAERVANANLLYGNGVQVAFTTKGNKTPTEFMENLRRAVKDGLSREAAIKGLTIVPARMFGQESRLGTVEQGKTANLTMLTADFLDEKTKVKMLYIDGRRVDPAATPTAPAPRSRFGEEGK